MSSNDIDKAYVSPIDKFLYEFDATHEKSESQLREIIKNRRIAIMRDQAIPKNELEEIWSDF